MTYPLTTTLNRIKACNPCQSGWQRGLAAAGKSSPDDEPILFSAIAETVGINNAIWCMHAEPQHSRELRLFAVWCARQVQHLMTDQRSLAALDVAERHANGHASAADLAAASAAAWDAASAAASAAAGAAARDAALAAARAAARDAALAVIGAAAWDGARDAAWDGARDAQYKAFIQLCNTGTLP